MTYPLQLKQHLPVKQKLWMVVTEVIFNLVSSFIIGYLRIYIFFSKRIRLIRVYLLQKTRNVTIKRF